MIKNENRLMRLLQFTDSTFPVGTFSFSNGLETAAHIGLVHDRETLKEYVSNIAIQAAFCDGIAALHAFRFTLKDKYEGIVQADKKLILVKMNDESRIMLKRMGKKMAELGIHIFESHILNRWLEDIKKDITPGTYPIAQGIVFAVNGLSEEDLFYSHQYGVINMVLSAALRCVRVSHYDTQSILYELSEGIYSVYEQVNKIELDEMNAFVPEIDICASLHEKGTMRMFMN